MINWMHSTRATKICFQDLKIIICTYIHVPGWQKWEGLSIAIEEQGLLYQWRERATVAEGEKYNWDKGSIECGSLRTINYMKLCIIENKYSEHTMGYLWIQLKGTKEQRSWRYQKPVGISTLTVHSWVDSQGTCTWECVDENWHPGIEPTIHRMESLWC